MPSWTTKFAQGLVVKKCKIEIPLRISRNSKTLRQYKYLTSRSAMGQSRTRLKTFSWSPWSRSKVAFWTRHSIMKTTFAFILFSFSIRLKLWARCCFMKQKCQFPMGIAQYENTAMPLNMWGIDTTHQGFEIMYITLLKGLENYQPNVQSFSYK